MNNNNIISEQSIYLVLCETFGLEKITKKQIKDYQKWLRSNQNEN